MSENFNREGCALLPHDHARDVAPSELSDLDLEAVSAGKEDSPEGRRDLKVGGGLNAGRDSWISWAAFKQYRFEFWGQFGLAPRRKPD